MCSLTFQANTNQDGHQLILETLLPKFKMSTKKHLPHKNDYNSVKFTDLELKFGVA